MVEGCSVLEWVDRVVDRVDELAKTDPVYQELAEQRLHLEGAFDALLDRLGGEDRELLLEYMDIVGNMQYSVTQLAWHYGRLHPKKG